MIKQELAKIEAPEQNAENAIKLCATGGAETDWINVSEKAYVAITSILIKDSKEYQVDSAIHAAEARIENGANVEDAFNWLRDELQRIEKGEEIYD